MTAFFQAWTSAWPRGSTCCIFSRPPPWHCRLPLEERLCGPARPAARHSGRSGDGWGAAAWAATVMDVELLRRCFGGFLMVIGGWSCLAGTGALPHKYRLRTAWSWAARSLYLDRIQPMPPTTAPRIQHQQGDAAEQVFGHGVKPAARGLAAGQVDLLQHIVLSAYPEEHHCGQQGADGADVDGAHIHPVGHDGGDDQPDAHAEGAGDSYGRGALQVEQLLKGWRWGPQTG